jgi:hypothetical protein
MEMEMEMEMKKLILFLSIWIANSCLGKCPKIEGSYTLTGKTDAEDAFYIEKINCSTFNVTRFMGDFTLKISLDGKEECQESPDFRLCASGKYLSQNKIILSYREITKSLSCVEERTYEIDESERTVERKGLKNCKGKGVFNFAPLKYRSVK